MAIPQSVVSPKSRSSSCATYAIRSSTLSSSPGNRLAARWVINMVLPHLQEQGQNSKRIVFISTLKRDASDLSSSVTKMLPEVRFSISALNWYWNDYYGFKVFSNKETPQLCFLDFKFLKVNQVWDQLFFDLNECTIISVIFTIDRVPTFSWQQWNLPWCPRTP